MEQQPNSTRDRHRTADPVITGMGLVSPLGLGIEDHVRALQENRSAIGKLTRFDPPEQAPELVGEVPEFDVENYVLTPKAYLDRSSELMFAALSLALSDLRKVVDW